MIEPSVCVEMIFADLAFEDRLRAVAGAGFKAYEFWDWPSKDLTRVNALRTSLGLNTAAFILEPRGALVKGVHHADLAEGLGRSAEVAHQLGCENLIVLVGRERNDISRSEQRRIIVAGLKGLAPIAEQEGVTLLIEPLNTVVDHPGFFLSSSKEAWEIVAEVGSPSVKVLFDVYHQQVSEGNLIANITSHITSIGYFHIADVPGRHEPGTGEINYANVLKAITDAGYAGYCGLEYKPLGDHTASLGPIGKIFQEMRSRSRMREG
jgi:hydroxypyruvate isomerase